MQARITPITTRALGCLLVSALLWGAGSAAAITEEECVLAGECLNWVPERTPEVAPYQDNVDGEGYLYALGAFADPTSCKYFFSSTVPAPGPDAAQLTEQWRSEVQEKSVCGCPISLQPVVDWASPQAPRANQCSGSSKLVPAQTLSVETVNDKYYQLIASCAGNSPTPIGSFCVSRRRLVNCAPGTQNEILPSGNTLVSLCKLGTVAPLLNVGECKKTCPPMPIKAGNPIHSASGNKYQREVDYTSPVRGGLRFVRHYNSYPGVRFATLGRQWRHSYERAVELIGLTAGVARADGKVVFFTRRVSGAWRSRAGTTARLEETLDANDVRTGWVYRLPDDSVERYDAQGRLLAITSREGFTQSLAYDAAGRLASVTGPFGRTLQFAYAGIRLAQITDPAGGVVRFAYANGLLERVSYPDATPAEPLDDPTRRYHYENAAFPRHLTGLTDERGVRLVTWTYDAEGRATSSTYAGGAKPVTLAYNADGTTTVSDATGSQRVYSFEVVNGVYRLRDIAGGRCATCADVRSATLDANGYPQQAVSYNGRVTDYRYDAAGLELERTEAVGTPEARSVATEWHPVLRRPVRITEPGRVTTLRYDAAGRVLTRTQSDAASGRTRTVTNSYDAAGLLAAVDGPRTDVADVTTFSYRDGVLASARNALGQQVSISAHDAHGRPTVVRDANGLLSELRYDARGRLVERRVDGLVTRLEHDQAGNLVRVTLPDASFIANTYDGAGRLVALSDALGNRIEYTLDAAGQRTAERVLDAQGNLARTRSQVFDTLGRLVTTVGGEGQTRGFEYDATGNLLASLDARGARTAHAYDALERLASTTDATGAVTRFAYDARDNLVAVTDARGLTTRYGYDGLDDLTFTNSPDSGLSSYVTDAAGNRTLATDARGVAAVLAYDALNRLTAVRYPEPANDVDYGYDAGVNGIGRVSSVRDASGETVYGYDVRGNRVAETRTVAGMDYALGYAYDTADRLAAMRYPSGAQVTYSRDAAGRVVGVALVREGLTTVLAEGIGYRPFGPADTVTLGNGLAESRRFDRDGRITGLDTVGVLARGYAHDANDNVASIDDVLAPGASQAFGYDALDRLRAASGGYGALDYSYDALGNRVSRTGPEGLTLYAYDANSNRLLDIAGPEPDSLAYDAAGNVTARAGREYRYDAAGRLAGVLTGGAEQATYSYNANGERATRTTAPGTERFVYGPGGELLAATDATGAVRAEYVYRDGALLARLEPGTGAGELTGYRFTFDDPHNDQNGHPLVLRSEATVELDPPRLTLREQGQVVYSEALIAWHLRDPVTVQGEPHELTVLVDANNDPDTMVRVLTTLATGAHDVSVRVSAPAPGTGLLVRDLTMAELVGAEDQRGPGGTAATVRYYHLDHLGTPQALSDEAGNVVWRGEYRPFGEVVETLADAEQRVRLPGQYVDEAVGGYYNYWRWYEPETGRYLRSDPIGLDGGINTYVYVGGNPIGYSDPSGLACGTGLCIGAGIAAATGVRALLAYIGGRAAVVGGIALALGIGESLTQPQNEPAPTIDWPDKKPGKYVCVCRAQCRGDCLMPGEDQQFGVGAASGTNFSQVKKAAQKAAQDLISCQGKHTTCKCIDPKGQRIPE